MDIAFDLSLRRVIDVLGDLGKAQGRAIGHDAMARGRLQPGRTRTHVGGPGLRRARCETAIASHRPSQPPRSTRRAARQAAGALVQQALDVDDALHFRVGQAQHRVPVCPAPCEMHVGVDQPRCDGDGLEVDQAGVIGGTPPLSQYAMARRALPAKLVENERSDARKELPLTEIGQI